MVTTKQRRSRFLSFIGISVLVHAVLVIVGVFLYVPEVATEQPLDVEILTASQSAELGFDLDAAEDRPEREGPPAPTPVPKPEPAALADGQIVELPEPVEKKAPKEARFLAEHNRSVEEETSSIVTAVNPRIVTPEFHPDEKLEIHTSDLDGTGKDKEAASGEEAIRNELVLKQGPGSDFGERISSITSIGGDRYRPNSDPGPSSRIAEIHGAPQNDLIRDVKIGSATHLNAREFVFASFYNRVKRQVNPFWVRNLNSGKPSEKIDRKEYTTVVHVILTNNGRIAGVELAKTSAVAVFDDAVVKAFREAAPFVNPPGRLAGPDGLIRLRDLAFTVSITPTQAVAPFVDLRQGIMFPGIERTN